MANEVNSNSVKKQSNKYEPIYWILLNGIKFEEIDHTDQHSYQFHHNCFLFV
jgi:hypothetical protein